jgi:hypothetical protein
VERGEAPALLIKRTKRQRTGELEVEIVFHGQHHDERHSYYTKDPKDWTTFGDIIVTPAKAREVAGVLNEAGSPTLLDFKPRIVSLGGLRKIICAPEVTHETKSPGRALKDEVSSQTREKTRSDFSWANKERLIPRQSGNRLYSIRCAMRIPASADT